MIRNKYKNHFVYSEINIFIHSLKFIGNTSIKIITYSISLKTNKDESADRLTTFELIT
jgi:hypothetical protein